MRIGILTFHWATNYGAVLQSYALQEYLQEKGYDVEIINYKPYWYDFWLKYIRRPWLLRNLKKDLLGRRKERKLMSFRKKYLNLTRRYYSNNQMKNSYFDYDIVISGSDQILNPTYTLSGEESPTSAYFLTAFPNSMRIGYAVSFGCNEYPEKALRYAKSWIVNFDRIGVREQTGLSILKSMEYPREGKVVPDPTILRGRALFKEIAIEHIEEKDYICAYILRKHVEIKNEKVVYIDDFHNPLSMEQWLGVIIGSKYLITNSYHGMIVAILNHIPFSVLADAFDMNDRFYTLLNYLELTDRILSGISEFSLSNIEVIDWENVETKLSTYRQIGCDFFNL